MSKGLELLQSRIRARLAEKNITAKAVSEIATGKPDAVQSILGRGYQPSALTLAKIADVLETSTDYLLGRADDPDAPAGAGKPGLDVDMIRAAVRFGLKMSRKHRAEGDPLDDEELVDMICYLYAEGFEAEGGITLEQKAEQAARLLKFTKKDPPPLAEPEAGPLEKPGLAEKPLPTLHDSADQRGFHHLKGRVPGK